MIGLSEDKSDDVRLMAIDGASGEKIWDSEPVTSADSAHDARAFLGGDTVYVAAPAGELLAFSTRDGGQLWNIRTSDNVEEIAGHAAIGEETSVLARLADDSWQIVDAERGTILGTPKPEHVQGAIPLPSSHHPEERASRTTVRVVFADGVPSRSAFDGVQVEHALYSHDGTWSLALGKRAKGTPVPLLLRYESAPDDKGFEELWRANVPASNPLEARLPMGLDGYLDADAETAATLYRKEDVGAHEYRAVAFDMRDGRRLWEERVPGTSPVSSVTLENGRLYVQTWEQLHVFDAREGKRLFGVSAVEY